MKPPKSSKSQNRVFSAMKDGWELGWFPNNRRKLQKGGLGNGGIAMWVSYNTLTSLLELGVIEEAECVDGVQKYRLVRES